MITTGRTVGSLKQCKPRKRTSKKVQRLAYTLTSKIISERSDIVTAIIQFFLWAFIITEILDRLAPLLEKLDRRRRLKELIKLNMRMSENALTDYAAGYFYGKAKQYEIELQETRLFYD